MQAHKVVSHDERIAARKAHLAAKRAFSRARDELSYGGAVADAKATYRQPKTASCRE